MKAPTDLWRLVAARELRVRLTDRNFIISFAVTLGMIVLSFGLSALLSNRSETVEIAVASPAATSIVTQADALAKADGDKIELKPIQVSDAAGVQQRVQNEKADLGLVPAADGALTLVGRQNTDSDGSQYLEQAYASSRLQQNAQTAGTSLQSLTAGTTLGAKALDPDGVSTLTQRIAGTAFGFVFFMASLLFGLAIAQSVVAEKENRIVEILAGLVPIRQLLIGKIAGNTVLAMGQLVVMAAVALVGLKFAGYGNLLPSVGGAAGWFLAFFLVGFLALAALFAAAGALATRNEDLQQTQNPVMMMVAVVLFAGVYLPAGTAQTVASFVPMVNIVAMPTRIVGGEVAWWEPVLSLLILAAMVVALVRLAERIYRRSLMQTGGRLTIRQAMKVRD